MPSLTPAAVPASIDDPDCGRHAGRELLSLALMDARNHSLHLLSHYEQAAAEGRLNVPSRPELELPQWLAGHIGWLAEYWIGRNPQRSRGAACPPDAVRLASIEPMADQWFNPALATHAVRWQLQLPDFQAVRAYLLDTLESTLELLDKTAEDDEGLYFFRVALFHEDIRCEQLVTMAQALGVPLKLALPVGVQARDPVLVPAGRWLLGSSPGGFVFDVEKWAHEVDVPEFEIDAQPVNWGQYVEFVDDGGYDRPEFWLPQGWEWLQREARSGGQARAALRGADRVGQRRRHADAFRQVDADGRQPERDAPELVGGRCLGALGRAALADRGGMGDGRAHGGASRLSLGRRARVDRQHAAAVARIRARCLEPAYGPGGATAVRPGPGATRRVFRGAFADEASQIPRLRAAGAR